MIQRPNGCHCSDLRVNPANWENNRASCKKDWYIYYRYYDPLFRDNPRYKKGKLVLVKGMNTFAATRERQLATREIMAQELDRLTRQGYNPITGQYAVPMAMA